MSTEEATKSTQLIFPYRGVYVRHIGHRQAVAESNQVLFFNAQEGYRVSHPVSGGDGSLTFLIEESQLRELVPQDLLDGSAGIHFRQPSRRIDARIQARIAELRYRLHHRTIEPLEAEVLALKLVQRALGPRSSHSNSTNVGLQKLADRAKLVLAGNLARRWTLAEVAKEVRTSPVYLTQVFQKVEGLPLYQYQIRLRLSRALELLSHREDLTNLALELGFSSHSHFSAVFRQHYGYSPSAFRRSALGR